MSWHSVALGEIFEIARGGSPRPINDYLTEDPDGLNWVSISDATRSGKIIEATERRIRPEGLKKSRWVEPGDFLLSNSMSFGRPYIMGTTGCIHDGWLVLKPGKIMVDPDYLYHLLGSAPVFAQFAKRATGTTVKNLNTQIVSETEIPLPDFPEQQRIAAILDKADALRRMRRQSFSRLSELRQAIFFEMFGDWSSENARWDLVELGKCLDFLTSGSRGWAKYYADEGARFIRIQNVRRGYFDWADLAHVNAPSSAEARRTKVQRGDVLLSITADLGRVAVVPDTIGDAYINQHLALIRSSSFNPHFLAALLTSPAGQRAIMKKDRSAVKSGLNFDDIRSLRLIAPPKTLQDEFERRLLRIDSLERQYERDAIQMGCLFASLQQRAFRGKL